MQIHLAHIIQSILKRRKDYFEVFTNCLMLWESRQLDEI